MTEVAGSQNKCWLQNATEADPNAASMVKRDPTAVMFPCGFLLTGAGWVKWPVSGDVYPFARRSKVDRDKYVTDNFDIMSSYSHIHTDQCDSFPAQLLFLSRYLLPQRPQSITTMAPVPATVGTWECFGLRSPNFGATGHV